MAWLMIKTRSRRRGKGSLQSYQTKAGVRWRFQIWIPLDAEQPELGDKKFSRGGFVTSDDADDAMQEALRKRRNDESFHGAVPTLKQYATDWLEALTLEASTLRGYRRQVNNYIVPHLGSKPLDKITGPAVGKLYKLLRERGGKDGAPLGANTIAKTAVNLTAILDSAIEDGYLTKNPARHKDVVRSTPKGKEIRREQEEMEVWDADQLRTFLTWNQNVYKDDLHVLWLTFARTGMRRGEVVALQWRDLDFKAGRISIRRAADSARRGKTKLPKSGRSRVIDADAKLMSELKAFKAARGAIALDLARPNSFIFGDDSGILKNPQFASKAWARRMKQARKVYAELPEIGVHGLRHTHATLLFQLGEQPKVVSERLGHSTISITMDIYQSVLPSMQRAAADKFAELLG